MQFIATRLLPLLVLGQIAVGSATAQQRERAPDLRLGDAVVTGFSGTVAPIPGQRPPANRTAIDLTFINPDGPSARIIDITKPGAVWDGAVIPAPKPFDVLAKDVGQVFGLALDDAPQPNIYLSATAAFGLNIVARGANGQPERRKKGGPGVGWMNGQFGLDLQGGPGAIYKIDGRTGVPTLFANVTLDGVPNPAAGLGSLAYDAANKQLFVSDLYTGMIHRFDLDGRELDRYDHGVTGLTAARLAPVAFDPRNRPNIANDRFDSEKPETWGFAPAARRVWGLALHQGRLYYSVTSGPQIWSIGLAQDGRFANDPRWELDVPAQAGALPISDIAFSNKGAMILAQRAPIAASYDYSAFTRPAEPQVFRVWLKGPQDPPSPGRWKPVPEEYAVGFAGNYRNTNGGVALGYGYGRDGALSDNACEFSLWTTGQNLRNAPALRAQLDPGGALVVHGIQGLPSSPVRNVNTPPWLSYTVGYGDSADNPRASGHLGSIRINTKPCAAPTASYGGPGYPASAPYTFTGIPPICIGPNCGSGRRIDIAIKKTAGPVTFDSSTGTWSVTFTLLVKNTGMSFSPGNNISINDAIPPGMTLGPVSGTGWACTGLLNCGYTFGSGVFGAGNTLPPLTVTLTTTTPGTYTNCATTKLASYSEATLANNKDCATIKALQPVDIEVKKTSNYLGGGQWGYTLQVNNAGTTFTTTGGAITITDPVPPGMTFTGYVAPGWLCNTPVSFPGTLSCSWTAAGTFPPGPIGSIVISTTRTGPGPWVNCTELGISTATDTDLSNNKSCASIPGAPIDIAIEKTGTTTTDALDGNYTFYLTIKNILGPFIATNVITVTDTAPPGMTFAPPVPANPLLWNCGASTPTMVSCTYIGTTPLLTGISLIDVITVNGVGTGTGPGGTGPYGAYTNCADATVIGGLTDANLADNNSCVTLNKTPGGFDVVKKVQNNTNGVLPATTPYTVSVSCPGYAPVTFTLTDGGPPYSVSGIAQGTGCTVSEPGPMPVVPAGFCNAGFIPVWATETYSPSSSVSVTSGPQTVTVQNTLNCVADATIGNVDVVKAIVDNTGTGLLPATWPYTINFSCLPPGAASNATLTFPGAGTQTKVNIPVTSVCTAVEVPPAVPPGVCPLGSSAVWAVPPPSGSVTVVAGPGSSGTLTVTNTLNCVADVITVNKVVVNNTTASLPPNTYPVQVICGSDLPLSANFTAPGTQTVTPTTPGGSCTATEVLTGLAVPAFVCPGNLAPVWSNNAPVGPVSAPGTLTVTNTLDCPVPPVGTIYVLKRVHYNNTSSTMPSSTVYPAVVTCGGTTVASLSLLGNIPQSVTNIAYGSLCSVSEPSQPPIPAGICKPGSTATWLPVVITPPTSPDTLINAPLTMFFIDNTMDCVPDAVPTGNVDVVKNVIDNSGGTIPVIGYPLTLTCSGTNWTVPSPPNTPQNISGITVGASCGVTEAPIAVPPGACTGGKVGTWTMTPPANIPVVAGPASSGTLTFTNQLDCACPTGTTANAGGVCEAVQICLPPMVTNAAGVCGPVTPPICLPPMVANAAGVCECPAPNVMNAAGVCGPVTPPVCQPPMVTNAAGVCECPAPNVMNAAGVCGPVTPPVCQPPMVQNAAGACVCQPPMVMSAAGVCFTPTVAPACPPGLQRRGTECVRPPIVCRAPLVANAAGTECVCRAGLVMRGGRCVEPVVCRPPAFLNRNGTGCDCPEGYVKQGNSCERRRPVITPNDVIRVLPGLVGPGGGGRQDGGGSSGTDRRGNQGGGTPGVR